jgi:hypothetical protein
MKFTVEIRSGLCNVLKAFVTALSIGETNILPRFDAHFDANFSEIVDDSLICHGPHEFGESFITARFLILKEEESEQDDLINDAKALGDHPNIANKSISYLFSTHSIDWFYDRTSISDRVFNRIMSGIQKIKWRNEILVELENLSKQIEYPLLTVQIRTWTHKFDPPNCTSIRDGVIRDYNFETYKNAIDILLPKAKTIFITSDNDNVLPEYEHYLKDHKVMIYKQPSHLTQLQYSTVSMLLGAKSDMLVCSRLSTYAECMWWFGGCKAWAIPLF